MEKLCLSWRMVEETLRKHGGPWRNFEIFYIQKHSCPVSSDIRHARSDIHCPWASPRVSKMLRKSLKMLCDSPCISMAPPRFSDNPLINIEVNPLFYSRLQNFVTHCFIVGYRIYSEDHGGYRILSEAI